MRTFPAPADPSFAICGVTPDELTEREKDVMTRICRGLSNQEIADDLYLSLNSVKTYIRGAYRKIGATTRSRAVVWGMGNGFAPEPIGAPAA